MATLVSFWLAAAALVSCTAQDESAPRHEPFPPAGPAAPSFTLGEEQIQGYPNPHPYQFPDAAISVLGTDPSSSSRLMFWSDGTTYRVEGPGLFPNNTPFPLTPVLGAGAKGTYDANGNWFLAVFPETPDNFTSLVGFTHTENHGFDCNGSYAEWNFGAVVSSEDGGVSWTREGLAIADPQPCTPTFGGAGYSSVIRVCGEGGRKGYLGYGGCTGFVSSHPQGAPGTWYRYLNGGFTSPGVNGTSTCLPGVPQNVCCPIVHWNAYLGQYIMVYNKWGQNSVLYMAASSDGISWGPSVELLRVDATRSLAYGQVLGGTNSSVVGQKGVLAYAVAPPTGPYPRDFVFRDITFGPTSGP